ncbi:MAG TPA: hypothetical protein VEJ18_04010 [Planctomycetota bacterium]|nr:hypothetical protein [Planctomycetota bacterium]
MTLLAILLLAQVETFAGTGQAGTTGDGGPAARAQVNNPFGVVRGPDGAVYFCEYDGQVVRRVGPDGTITTVAGSGEKGYAGDGGPALKAAFNKPHEIRFDPRGDLYIADMANHAIRKVDLKSGVVSTVAGNGQAGYAGDGGPAAQSRLKQPHSLQFGPGGDLYICDIGNHVIRRVDAKTGRISTFAGTGKAGPTPDGAPLRGTPLNGPRSLDVDAGGDLWLATREGNQVFRLDLKAGRIHHIAGTGKKGFTGNGRPAREATLSGPKGIAVGPAGDVFLVDTESHTIRVIDPKTGRIDVLVGTGAKGDGPDGPPLACRLARPHGVWVDPDGAVFIGDSENHRLRVLRRSR